MSRRRQASRTSTAESWASWPPAFLVAVVALAVFARSWSNEFTSWDDGAYITNNPHMTEPGGLYRIWFTSESEQYYPLTFTSFWLEYRLWGLSPAGYHVTSTLLHAANAALVLVLSRALGMSRPAPLLTALLFAVHPLQLMSVAWVAERKNLLSCLFSLLTYLAWMRFRQRNQARWYALALMTFVLAVLSKSAVVVLPAAIAVLDRLVLRQPLRRILPAIAPMAILAIASVWITLGFERKFIDPGIGERLPSLSHRIPIAAAAIWFYVYKLVAPVGLLPVYPLWDLSVSPWLWRLPLVGLAFALAIVFALRQRIHGLALWGLSHFVILLSPALGLIPFGNMAVTYVSDHFVYVASIGFFISIGVVVGRLIERSPASKRLTIAAGTLACVALSVLTIRYIPTFRNSGSMWSATLAGNPDCYPAHVGLGQDHLLRGELTDAQYHYGRAVQSDSNRIEGHAGLGAVAVKRNDWVQAEASLRRALAIDPGFGPALADLGFVHQNNQQFDEALALYEAALRGDPRDAQTHLRAAELLLVLSRRSDALPHFQAVVDLRPKLELGYQGVAQCLRGLRRYAEAVGLLQAGLVQAPDGVALKNMLAITLAAAPDASLRDGPRALRLAEEVCQATEYKNPQALDTLAAALAEVGRFDEAARTARQAEALAKAARDDRAAQASAGWAAGYEQKRPRRDPA